MRVSALETSFPAGCNTIMAAVTAKGQTPSSNSPSDIATAISNIQTGYTPVWQYKICLCMNLQLYSGSSLYLITGSYALICSKNESGLIKQKLLTSYTSNYPRNMTNTYTLVGCNFYDNPKNGYFENWYSNKTPSDTSGIPDVAIFINFDTSYSDKVAYMIKNTSDLTKSMAVQIGSISAGSSSSYQIINMFPDPDDSDYRSAPSGYFYKTDNTWTDSQTRISANTSKMYVCIMVYIQ